jgi:hypothetical protein
VTYRWWYDEVEEMVGEVPIARSKGGRLEQVQGFHLTSESFSPDWPIVKRCEHFHLMQLATFECR